MMKKKKNKDKRNKWGEKKGPSNNMLLITK